GRPTLEAKRNAELNPIKSLQEFWRDDFELMRGRFELLDKEKPTVLIDNAQNLDALENLFLGIRLLHYQKPLRGLALVLGLKKTVDAVATLKVVRYLMKKVSGQLFFAPLPGNVDSYSTDDLVKIAHGFNLNAKGYNSIEQAFDVAKKTVDDRYGLVCLTGSPDVPSVYWRSIREMKKF
ncbi:hypothetical protein HOD08_00540, partial [bacterium]|nr:hypothetical protein [bacterium]